MQPANQCFTPMENRWRLVIHWLCESLRLRVFAVRVLRMRHALWAAAQWLLAPGYEAMLRRTVREQLGPLGAGRWLDVGCGSGSRIAQALPGTLVGIDSAANVLYESRCDDVAYVCASATALPFEAANFDGVVCFGLLHHLDDADADTALAEMRRVARPGGVILVFDSVSPRSALRRPLAALLRALDRGRHIRDEAALRRLLESPGFDLGPRVTYSWTGLEGCWATLVRRRSRATG
jgi:SAM-dependent methyltransferase